MFICLVPKVSQVMMKWLWHLRALHLGYLLCGTTTAKLHNLVDLLCGTTAAETFER